MYLFMKDGSFKTKKRKKEKRKNQRVCNINKMRQKLTSKKKEQKKKIIFLLLHLHREAFFISYMY